MAENEVIRLWHFPPELLVQLKLFEVLQVVGVNNLLVGVNTVQTY